MADNWATGDVGKVTFEGADVCMQTWDFDPESTRIKTTNACNPGIETSTGGNIKYTGSFSGVWDLDNHFTDTFFPGATGTLKLYVSATQFISVPVEITGIPMTSDVDGAVEYTANFEATAAPTYPV